MRAVTLSLLAALSAVSALASPIRAEPLKIKIATTAPTGSLWHTELKALATMWRDLSGGQVTVALYTGATMGDEADIVKKLRIGQLHGAVLSSHGLYEVTPHAVALDLPLQLASETEYDAVAKVITPTLDAKLAEKGYVALGWTHVGWTHMFSTTARPTFAQARTSKLWAPDEPTFQVVLSAVGFKSVLLSWIDVVPSLTTGIIDAVPAVPVIALALRLHDKARFMLDLPLSALSGALVIEKKVWDTIPASLRTKLEASARTVLGRMTIRARSDAAAAVTKLKAQGLSVVAVSDLPEWSKAVQSASTAIRGKWLPAETYDAVVAATKAFRAAGP